MLINFVHSRKLRNIFEIIRGEISIDFSHLAFVSDDSYAAIVKILEAVIKRSLKSVMIWLRGIVKYILLS